MELKDIKALQDMGFSLDEIKAVYYPEQTEPEAASPVPDTPAPEAPAEAPEPSKKKRFFRILQVFGKKDR